LAGPRSHLTAEVLQLPHDLLDLLLQLPEPLLRPRLAAPGSSRAALRWTTGSSTAWALGPPRLRAANTTLRRAARPGTARALGAARLRAADTALRRAGGTSRPRRAAAPAPRAVALYPHQVARADFDAPDLAPLAVLDDDDQDPPRAAVPWAAVPGPVAASGPAAVRALPGLAAALLGLPQPLFRGPQLLAGPLDFAARLAHVAAPVGAPVLRPAPARRLGLSESRRRGEQPGGHAHDDREGDRGPPGRCCPESHGLSPSERLKRVAGDLRRPVVARFGELFSRARRHGGHGHRHPWGREECSPRK